MKTLYVTVTRDVSKQIPCKNVRPFRAEAMTAWPIQTTLAYHCFDKIVSGRNKHLALYKDLLYCMGMKLLAIPEGVMSSAHLTVVKLKHISPKPHREVFEWLRQPGIKVRLNYVPVHFQAYYQDLRLSENQLSHSESNAFSSITLPLLAELENGDQQRIVDTLESQLCLAYTGD